MAAADAHPDARWHLSARVRRPFDELDQPATTRFVFLTIGFAWVFWFSMWNVTFRDFFQLCNHDPGAALRTDEIVAQGLRPGVDFYYYYGLLPILVGRAFFGLFGRNPTALLALLACQGAAFAAALASIVAAFKPTRLGTVLVALGMAHALTFPIPTHSLEAAMLIGSVALRVRGRNTAALTLAVAALFVKYSMATVLVAELTVLIVFDAVRGRTARPLRSLAAIPLTLAGGACLCAGAFGFPSLSVSFDPRGGAACYRAHGLGFFREGTQFWYPAGHTLGWYVGGLPGPWIVASTVLAVLACRSAYRLARAGLAAAPEGMLADQLYAIAGFANLAFIAAFFGPSTGGVYYYSWIRSWA